MSTVELLLKLRITLASSKHGLINNRFQFATGLLVYIRLLPNETNELS